MFNEFRNLNLILKESKMYEKKINIKIRIKKIEIISKDIPSYRDFKIKILNF